MSFGLAFPLGLLALLGLALPLLVHLARREQQQPTMFAALRWLRAAQRPRQRLRLEQWLLLALRMAIVAGLALLIAAPWIDAGDPGPPRVLVHPSLPVPDAPEGAQVRWLAPGFPAADTPAPEDAVPVASLLRQADAELPAGQALIVHVPAILDGADGERPRLSRPTQWQVATGAAPASTRSEAADAAPPTLALRHDSEHAAQARWLAAAQRAWQAGSDAPGPAGDGVTALDAPWPEATQVLAWLGDGAPPADVLGFARDGGTLLLGASAAWPADGAGEAAWRGADGDVRLRALRSGGGRVLQFTQPLVPAEFPELLDPRFPRWLLEHLQAPAPAPRRVDAVHYAPLAGAPGFTAPRTPLAPWLAVLLAALFLVERWLAAGQPARRPA